jgi:DNA-binding response OmpR family regulator
VTSGPPTHQQKKKKVLAVDNEPDMTTILKMALEHEGFSIDTFNDPMLALESFKPNLYGLAILDVMMPKMNGLELYDQLKKIDPKLKVCFLTASTETYRENLGHCELSRELFLYMPLTIKRIVAEIKRRIDSP